MIDLIKSSVEKFELNLKGYTVLTEAASGNYACTPLIASYAGAKVFAYGKESQYGSYLNVKLNIDNLEKKMNLNNITCINNLNKVDMSKIDILTNTGHLRPINKMLINFLSKKCVIPLMYEPWELRETDIDIKQCFKKGIKIFGTNESDPRLLTMNYIGYIVLNFLLKEKKTPFSARILLLGSKKFNIAIKKILKKLSYQVEEFSTDQYSKSINISKYNVIVFTEFVEKKLLVGSGGNALINSKELNQTQILIHIAGNVDFRGLNCKTHPKKPSPPHHMSFTTDFIEPLAVVDLHCAGLKVGEGMQKANKKKLKGKEYYEYMKVNYPSLPLKNKILNVKISDS